MIEMSVCVRQKSGNGYDRSSVVVVAVKAAKEVSRTALTWALTNVVKPGDCVRLLVVIPTHASSNILFLLSLSFFFPFFRSAHGSYCLQLCCLYCSRFSLSL